MRLKIRKLLARFTNRYCRLCGGKTEEVGYSMMYRMCTHCKGKRKSLERIFEELYG